MRIGRVRFAARAVTVVCFALATALIVDRHTAFVAAVRRTRRLDIELSRAYMTEAGDDRLVKATRFACAAPDPREESGFFSELRQRASQTGVTLVRLRSQAEPASDEKAPTGPPTVGKDAPEALTKGVTRIGCELVLDGSYPALRRFLNGLWESDRLYTMSGVAWNRAPSGTELTLTLSRYLSSQAPLPEASKP